MICGYDDPDDHTITADVQLVMAMVETINCVAEGKGSVEAIFNAIDQFFNQSVQLFFDAYNIEAVTDGIDSQARVLVAVGIRT